MERGTVNPKVMGSNPINGAKITQPIMARFGLFSKNLILPTNMVCNQADGLPWVLTRIPPTIPVAAAAKVNQTFKP